ncbi:TPA: glycosyltransferase [Vibrio vulnificus]|uniref:glycosyltransferase family 25 protein n=1 Tax=Vibrio vulnificus TaxID=672 RepID=UPI0019D4C0AE|nr:glycosyltransferase family 25 protein [Vibrio vulnificus]MBN8105351.1 glycosyltransferase family 25 protein [Vibrio vulnificus]HAS6066685.1 glycosyltransferase [Vibrio vulnificus]
MKVIVISLKRSVERRARIKAQLDSADIEFSFLDAVDAQQENFPCSKRRNDKLTRKRFGYKLVDSEVACFASHYTAWKLALEMNKSILVLEDNCDLSPAFFKYFDLLESLSTEFDFLKLCATSPKSYKTIKHLDSHIKIIRYYRRTCGIMGYVVSPKAAKAFIENATQFIEPVDDYMEKPYKHGIFTYCLSPDLVTRANINSTIGSSRKNKQGITLINKIYIESFRLYEQIKDFLMRAPD